MRAMLMAVALSVSMVAFGCNDSNVREPDNPFDPLGNGGAAGVGGMGGDGGMGGEEGTGGSAAQ